MRDVYRKVRTKVGDSDVVIFEINVVGEIASLGAYGKLDNGLC